MPSKVPLYLSFDLETDGSSPTVSNMLSFGMVAFTASGEEVFSHQRNVLPRKDGRPEQSCLDNFWANEPELTEYVKKDAVTPAAFVAELSDLLKAHQKGHRYVWVASPACFDWMWLKGYYEAYGPADKFPIGYQARCISSMMFFYCKTNGISSSERAKLRKIWMDGLKHTHIPVDDAREQGHVFINLCKTAGYFPMV